MADQVDKKKLDQEIDEVLFDAPAPEPAGIEDPSILTEAEIADLEKEAAVEKQFGDRPLAAAGAGALSGATLGLSDQALTRLGIVDKETLRQIRARNRAAALTGEVFGTVAPLLVPGGQVAAAGKAASAAAKAAQTAKTVAPVRAAVKAGQVGEQLTARALSKILKDTGQKRFASEVIRKAVPKTAGSAVEGAALGAGELIREDALGEADFNAENLVSSVGTGALLGGVVGGVLGGVPALGTAIAKPVRGVKKRVAEKFKTLADPEDAALELYGVTPAKKTLLKKRRPDVITDLPEWTVQKAKLGAFSDADSLLKNVQDIRSSSGKVVGETLERIDDAGRVNPAILPDNSVYLKVADDLKENILNKFAGQKAFAAKLKPVQNLYDDFVTLAQTPGKANVSQLQRLRMQMDDLAKLEKEVGKTTLGEQAARRARTTLRQEIDDLAGRADLAADAESASLLRALKEANRDYSIASEMLPFIEKKVDKRSGIVSLTDLVAGDVASEIAGVPGVGVAVGAKKLLESDFRRRLAILSQVERQNQMINKRVGSSVKNFFKGKKAPTSLASTSILLKSGLSLKEDPDTGKRKKPKNRRQAFTNIKDNLNELTSNPEKLINRLTKSTIGISLAAPQTGAQVQNTLMRAIEFLKSKAPVGYQTGGGIPAFQREYQPSDAELSKFERYVSAVEDPMSALDDLQNGQATREQMEAIQVVYPNLYQRIVEETYEYISDPENKVSYSKRIQLGSVLRIPTDSSLLPQNIRTLQSQFIITPEEVEERGIVTGKARPQAKALNMAGRTQSGTEAFSNRKQEG